MTNNDLFIMLNYQRSSKIYEVRMLKDTNNVLYSISEHLKRNMGKD